MIVVNPPWRLDETLNRLLPELLRSLGAGERGQTRLEWLAPAP
jgi:23S rRNA A2030 N6-methylase RlmJ